MALGDIGTYEGYGFSVGASSGVIAAGLAANSDVFAFRNISSKRKIRLLRVTLNAAATGTAFAAGNGNFSLFVARAFSASDTGGTQIALTGNNQKLRTTQQVSQLSGAAADVRIASTGALGAGTYVLDAVPHGTLNFGVVATAGANLLLDTPIYNIDLGSYASPIVLDVNEGIIIRATVPGTGTFVFGTNMYWVEVDGGNFTNG